jgi:outer membrane protein assembly factor BamB
MQPLVTGNRIFTRLLYSANPLLACLEKSSGKLLWTAEAPPREFFVSDPVVVQGQLGAMSVSVQLEQQGLLRWNVLDPETGEVQAQRDLLRLRNTWGKRACCELVPLADSVVAVLGGITLALDPDGEVRWVRKHVTVPAEEDPRWILQTYQRPLLADGRMFVVQPGVRSIDSLDPATGRLHWSVVMPDVLGMVGLSGTSLVVRTERDLRALDRTSGQTLWRLPVEELHSFQLVDDTTLLVAGRERIQNNNDQWLTRLTWIDAHIGQPTKTCTLPNLTDNDPRLGPLVPYKDRVFTFFGRGQHDPNRDVVELVPVGEADAAITPEYSSDPWRQKIPPAVRNAAFRVLPDWLLTSGFDGDRTGLVADIHGERDVLGVRSLNVHAPIVLAREISLPAMGRPRLRLRMGTDGGQVWKLEARHGDQLLKTEEIKDETHPDRWKTIEIDLSLAAGKTGWLSVKLTCANGDHVLWLKSAEIVY